MVCDTTLWIVVRANTLGAISCTHLAFTVCCHSGCRFLLCFILQFSTQYTHCFFTVFELRTFILTSYHNTRWFVRNTNSRLRFINMLSTCTRRTVCIDFQIFFVDFDVDIFCFWQYRNSYRRRMDTSRRFCIWYTLHTMYATFKF